MDWIWQGFHDAFSLLLYGDPEIGFITLLTLRVSGLATLISLVIGLPFGTLLTLHRFRGRRLLLGLVNTGMAIPPVVVGLLAAILLWRSGPLGILNLIYTPSAMIFAQVIIATPVIAGLTAAALEQLDSRLRLQLLGLGASQWQMIALLWWEARLGLLAALMAGFGRAISEIGASMMIGGNIRFQTRVLTTAIVLETGKGNFDRAIALGLILLSLAFMINYVLTLAQQRRQSRS